MPNRTIRELPQVTTIENDDLLIIQQAVTFSTVNIRYQDLVALLGQAYIGGTGIDVTTNVISLDASINDLTDVNAGAPATNDILQWTGSQWIPSQSLLYTGGDGIFIDGSNDISLDAELDQINNVSVPSPATNQSLVFDGSNWVAGNPVLGINDLTDVETGISPPTTNQVLTWSGTAWVPGNSTANALENLSDVDFTVAPVINQILKFNGTNWYAANENPGGSSPTSIGDLTDVDITGITTGQLLLWDGLQFIPGSDQQRTPTILDKNLTPNVVTTDNADSGVSITATPVGYVEVKLNGLQYNLQGDKLGDCYFSNDGGATARALDAVVAGDTLYWNALISQVALDTQDRFTFNYVI